MSKSDNKHSDFKKIIVDFCNDLFTTFPEVKEVCNKYPHIYDNQTDDWSELYDYCKGVLPERFFDILYQNDDMFKNSEINTRFLIGIEFKDLWFAEDVTDSTRETMWKYLQLLLMTVVSDVSDGKSFGDTAKLFEAINEEEFKSKLEETFSNMKDFIDMSNVNVDDPSGINLEGLPSPEQMHEHISGILGGKLGKLAHEIAEETASEINMEGMSSVNDVFKNLFKNPTKLMGIVKNVGDKLDKKIKSGEINESELMKEASEIVKKMKNMPGMSNIQNMLKQMGLPADLSNLGNLSGKTKVNVNAMQSQLERNIKMAQTKEKMRKRAMERQSQMQTNNNSKPLSEEEMKKEAEIMKLLSGDSNNNEFENLIFSTGEKVERSSRKDKLNVKVETESVSENASSTKQKKKNKKKKD
jgi:hypothetical protein